MGDALRAARELSPRPRGVSVPEVFPVPLVTASALAKVQLKVVGLRPLSRIGTLVLQLCNIWLSFLNYAYLGPGGGSKCQSPQRTSKPCFRPT